VLLDSKMLQKTTLGKLSRAKIQKSFEKGEYEKYQTLNDEAIASHPAANYEGPANETEELVLGIFMAIFDIPKHNLGVNTNLFTMGVNSIDLVEQAMKLK
jgi:hypothetical protein